MTKRIEKLAADIIKADDDMTEQSTTYVIKTLKTLKHAMLNGRYYTRVDSVSRSGMSRKIIIRWIYKNEMHSAPDLVYKLAGCNAAGKIDGGGMDMLFAAQYNLYCALCDPKRQPYERCMKSYNNL